VLVASFLSLDSRDSAVELAAVPASRDFQVRSAEALAAVLAAMRVLKSQDLVVVLAKVLVAILAVHFLVLAAISAAVRMAMSVVVSLVLVPV
jgi:hypothetical protein